MVEASSSGVQQLLTTALQYHRAGNLLQAERIFRQVLAIDPRHADCLHLLGIIAYQTGRHDLAIDLIGKAIAIKPDFAEALSNYGNMLKGLGRFKEALRSYDKALAIRPGEPVFHFNRGNILQSLNLLREALASFDAALAIRPHYIEALSSRGIVLSNLNRFEEALANYNRILALNPAHVDALFGRASALVSLRRIDEALASYDRALAVKPDNPDAWNNRGNVLQNLQRLEEALASYEKALALKPDYAEVWNNHGNILQKMRRFEEALASYEKALVHRPDNVEVLNNRAISLKNLNRFEEALASCEAALVLRADYVEGLNSRGLVLSGLRRFEEALASYDKALAVKPDDTMALYNRGIVLRDMERFDESLACHERLLALDPEHSRALSGLAHSALNVCDWGRAGVLAEAMKQRVVAGKAGVEPFTLLGYGGDASLQLQCAKIHVRNKIRVPHRALSDGTAYRHDKVRIAYLSSDFRQHPVAFQIVQLLELHDRSRFDVMGVSTGADDGSEIRSRLIKTFDQFHDVQTQSDRTAAELLRRLEVDILIDLNGHTGGARPEILSHRPAPVQVNYFGYAGTLGADFMDYIIADPIAVPFDQQRFFPEKIVHLPDSYFVSDTNRAIGTAPTRREAGLPEQGFVFCAFNQNWKIVAPVFATWMRLLAKVPDSVLWLKDCNGGARNNLRRAAEASGINAQRLIFAGTVDIGVHLARHQLADLFLDTLPYNAHATACDALWAGLPLITCQGESFAGRVAASLLHAVGLPELVTNSSEDYEALALKLAGDPALLKTIRQKLLQNRLAAPLFDTTRYGRNIEAAYTRMWETAERGEAPKGFSIEPT